MSCCKPLYNVRPLNNLKEMLEQSQKLFGNKDAFLVKCSDGMYRGISFTQFKNDVDALGTAFIDLGLKDRFIAVIGENRYEWCVTYLATANGTGTIVPLDKELPLPEIENLLARSDISAIVFSGKYEKEMKQLAATSNPNRLFINMDAVQDENGFLSFKKLIERGNALIKAGERAFLDAVINNEAMNILLFTSGTTDLAKGVMLSHKNICTDITAVCSMIYIDSNDSVLSILPLHHTYECTCGFLVMIYNGCTIAFCEGLKHIAKNLQETKPSILLAVPLILEGMYKKLWDQAAKNGMKRRLKAAVFISKALGLFGIDIRKKLFAKIHQNLGGNIRLIISGAAAIEPSVSKGFRAMGFTILQGYGLTECSPIVTVNREKSFRNDSIGLLLPGMEAKIDKPDKNGIGEIVVKGGNVMLGYFENQLATEKVLKDGWFYTGDLGRMDSKGFFYITGRKKNVIVTKNGKNIFPEEVEAYLNKSPYILESLVWGKVDEASEETFVCAQIVPDIETMKEGLNKTELSKEEIFNIINAEVKATNKSMPLYKRIRQFTIREEEFAKTTTKKIKRYMEKIG